MYRESRQSVLTTSVSINLVSPVFVSSVLVLSLPGSCQLVKTYRFASISRLPVLRRNLVCRVNFRTPEACDTMDLTEAYQHLSAQFQQLQLQLQQLQHQDTSTLRATPTLEPIVSLPEKFDGNPKSIREFLSALRTIFRLQPDRYNQDVKQVGLAITLLRGRALSWFRVIEIKKPSLLHDFEGFARELDERFGDPNRRSTSQRQLRNLSQGSTSVLNYLTRFMELSIDTDFNDEALYFIFYEGLNDDVKDALASAPEAPDDFEDLTQLAIKIDNRQFERRQARRTPRGKASLSFPKNTSTAYAPKDPMPIKPVNPGPTYMDVDRTKKFQPLTGQEKQRRRELGLCLYCGNADHQVLTCPNKSRNVRSVTTDSKTTKNELQQ